MPRLVNRFRNFLLRFVAGSVLSVRLSEKWMALTFDDGPDPVTTPAVLDALARHGMRATFFLVGDRAERYPELVSRIIAEGHEVANHSWDHSSMTSLPMAEVKVQIAHTRDALSPHGQMLFRPPFGHQTLSTCLVARRLGYRVVIWSLVGRDWLDESAQEIADKIVAGAAPGAIVLLHDSLCAFAEERYRDRGPTLDAIDLVAEHLPHYRFVTMSDMLAAGAPVIRYWRRAPRVGDADYAPMSQMTLDSGSQDPAPSSE